MRHTAELDDLYEQLRCRATEGRPGGRDGLAVLRQQGLHAWIALATAQPARLPRAKSLTPAATPVAVLGPCVTATIDVSPLICLCTDMVLSKLKSPKPQELR